MNHIVFRYLIDDEKCEKIKPVRIIWSVSLIHGAIILSGLLFGSHIFGSGSPDFFAYLSIASCPAYFPVLFMLMLTTIPVMEVGILMLFCSCLLVVFLPSILMSLGFWFGNRLRLKASPALPAAPE